MEGRGVFGSKVAIVLATAGSAVGLGNVWRFPFMTGHNGGAAFILVYFGCVLLLGIPGMVSEFLIGWFVPHKIVRDEFTNRGTLDNGGLFHIYLFLVKYVCSICILFIFLRQFGLL